MKPKPASNKSQTNFTKLDQLSDDQIDFSDLEEVTPDMFAKAVVRQGLKPIRKSQITLRLDQDVLDWFRAQGSGYQTRINALLRSYMNASMQQKPGS